MYCCKSMMKYCVLSGSRHQKDTAFLEKASERSTKRIRGSYEEKLQDLGLFSSERKTVKEQN